MSNSVRPHRRQPTRLSRPWDSPDKNTGVGCHLLLQCMKVKSETVVTQLCPILSDPMDCSPPGSSWWIFQEENPPGNPPWDFPGKSTGVGCHCLLQSFNYLQIFQKILISMMLKFPLILCLFFVMLGLHCHLDFSLVVTSRASSLGVVCRLRCGAEPVVEYRL